MIEELRDFQAEDLPWFLANPRSMMLYEPRLGKTVETINILARDPNCTKIMIVAPKNAMFVWYDHLKEWFAHLCPDITLDIRLVRGKGSNAAAVRKEQYTKPYSKDPKVRTIWITTFGALDRDYEFLMLPSTTQKLVFNTVIVDECRQRLRNRKNKSIKIFNWLCRPSICKRVHFLDGTLASKGGPLDFWAILNIIDRGSFSSYWHYAGKWMDMVQGAFSMEVIGVKNLNQFHTQVLDKYSRRRFRHICAPHMPKIARDQLHVEPTTEQLKILSDLQYEKFAFTGDSMIVASTTLEQVLRARQVLTCPKIFSPSLGIGAAMEDLIERLTDQDISPNVEDRHIVIFTGFRQAMPHFEEALKKAGFIHTYQLYGGMEPELQKERIELFKQHKGIIICSIKYAMAFSLVPGSQCFFIGYEWDPNDNKQAEDRLIPQNNDEVNAINSYYYSYYGIDDGVADALVTKNKLITLTLGSARSLQTQE